MINPVGHFFFRQPVLRPHLYLLSTFNSRRIVCFWEKALHLDPLTLAGDVSTSTLWRFQTVISALRHFSHRSQQPQDCDDHHLFINPPHICLNQAFSVQFAFLPRGTRWQVASGGNSLSTQLAPTCQSVCTCATIVLIIVISIIIITTIESVIILFSSDLI